MPLKYFGTASCHEGSDSWNGGAGGREVGWGWGWGWELGLNGRETFNRAFLLSRPVICILGLFAVRFVFRKMKPINLLVLCVCLPLHGEIGEHTFPPLCSVYMRIGIALDTPFLPTPYPLSLGNNRQQLTCTVYPPNDQRELSGEGSLYGSLPIFRNHTYYTE